MLTTSVRLGIILAVSSVTLATSGAGTAPAKPAEKDSVPVKMDAFKVEGNYIPKLSFGLSLDMWKDNSTQRVTSIVIRIVRAGSEAEQKGLEPWMRILRIDGKPVEEFDASFFKGTDLNSIFVDRRNGAKVALEVWFPKERAARTVVLTEQRVNVLNFPGQLDRLQN